MSDATHNIDNGDFSAHDPWDANSNYWAKEAGRLNGENIVLRQRLAELEVILKDLLEDAGFYHSALELWMIDGEEFKERIVKALGGDDG